MIRRGLYRLDDIAAFVTDRVSTKDYIYAGIYFFPQQALKALSMEKLRQLYMN